DCQEPLGETHVGVMEDCAYGDSELIVARHALLDVSLLAGLARSVKNRDSLSSAAWADRAFRPADFLKVGNASLFRGKTVDCFEYGWLCFVWLVWFCLLHKNEYDAGPHHLSRG